MTNQEIEVLKAAIKEKEAEIRDKQRELDAFDISDYFDEDDFKEEVNDSYPDIDIMGCSYSPGDIWKQVDYIAFREGFNDWLDNRDKEEINEYQTLKEELEDLENELEDLETELEDLEDTED